MLDLRLEQIEFSNGNRFWLLVKPDGIPDFDSARFLASKYQEGKASNTLRNIANAIRIVKRFEEQQPISIRERLVEGRILSRSETAKLVSACGKPLGERRLSKVAELKKSSRSNRQGANKANTQRIRAMYAKEYIEFLVDTVKEPLRYDNPKRLALEAAFNKFEDVLDGLVPKKESTPFDPERPLTQESVEKIKDLTAKDQDELAAILYKQKGTRRRNLLIVEILLDTGCRASELARMLIEDIDEKALSIWIRRHREKSRSDTRQNRPGFKTRERKIRITEDLMQRIKSYISDRKGGRPRSAKHEYVFCANGREARQISLSSIYKIVRALEVVFGSRWTNRISPHVLRHTFFDIWFREANDKYDFRNNPDLFEQVVTAAEFTGGWAPDSKMIHHYKQRFVFEQASEITLGTQRRMYSGAGKGDKNS